MLADEGIKAEGGKFWSDDGQASLAAVPLRPVHRIVINGGCGLLEAAAIPIGRLEKENRTPL